MSYAAEGVHRRRPLHKQMPGQPIRPKPADAPRNPFAFRNRHHGKGFDTWASLPQDADFREEDVKRDDEGKFATQGGSGGAAKQPHRRYSKMTEIMSHPHGGVYVKDTDGNVWMYGLQTGQLVAHSGAPGTTAAEFGGEGWKKEPGNVLKQGDKEDWLKAFSSPENRKLPEDQKHQTIRAKKGKHAEAEAAAKASAEKWDKMSPSERQQWFKDHPGKGRVLARVNKPPYDEPHMMMETSDGTFKVKKEEEHYGGSRDPYFSYHWKTVGEFDTKEAAEKELHKRTDPEQLRQQAEAREAERERKWQAGAPQRAKQQAERDAREKARSAAREASKREMTPELSALEKVRDQLSERDREFADSLIEQHKYGKNPLSDRQTPWVKTLTERAAKGPAKADPVVTSRIDKLKDNIGKLDTRSAEAAQSISDYYTKNQRFASEKQESYFNKLYSRATGEKISSSKPAAAPGHSTKRAPGMYTVKNASGQSLGTIRANSEAAAIQRIMDDQHMMQSQFRRSFGRRSRGGGGGSVLDPKTLTASLSEDAMTWQSPPQANDWDSDWRPPGWGSPSQDREFAEHRVNRDSVGKFAHQRQLPHHRDKRWKSPRQDEPTTSERNLIEDARIKALDFARRLMGRDTVSPMRIASDRLMAMDRALVKHTLKSQTMRLAMDQSMRSFSADGHLHVAHNRISRASVNPYLGQEIPDSENLGLQPNRKYMLLRHPDELAKAAASFNGLPILIDHKPISADEHPSDLVVGCTGDSAKWEPPFLTNSLHIWSTPAIDAITSNERRELSCAYHYTPVMTPGVYEGKAYDGIMTEIHGNHVALVPDGRVGPAAVVADELPLTLAISAFFE